MIRRWPANGQTHISLQLIALLIASLVVAQVISFATMMLTPPPRPPVYRIADVAAALRGGPLALRWGRPLIRSRASVLPDELRAAPPDREHLAGLLATELGVALGAVRLVEAPPPAEWRLIRWLRPLRGREEGGWRPGAGQPRRFRPGWADGAIVGGFTAAARQADGAWIVLRTTSEPFPTAWQVRILLCLAAGLLIAAPAGYLFARRITAPLKRFTEAAEALGRDPHRPLMTLTGPAEIGAAAQAFNDMQVRLRRYIDDRTAMVGAISHDLRTPLARIRFKIESAPPRLHDSILRDVVQMEEMIGAVLAFIRDEGAPRTREQFDLLSLLECVVDDAAMVGADAQLVEGEPITVQGDPIGLRRLFGNLVDNALKYGGEARVRLRAIGDLVEVEIADRGGGLSAEELTRVFQPFYRTDASRNLDQAGVGLGLTIARSTARAHGGEVVLTSDANGARAIVTLPLATLGSALGAA
ncbi:MAG: sensor histidine kinase [Phenylobacterium sp.]|nr:sensor histidine kinase [Phenylobacterium sp.]